MGKNLAKSPLVALFYAALLYFAAVFLPFTEGYTAVLAIYNPSIPLTGYLMLIGYCLWIAVIAAIVFAASGKKSFAVLPLLLPALLGLQWVIPMMQQLIWGDITGIMDKTDTMLRLAQCCGATIVAIVLCALLFEIKPEEEKKPATQAVKQVARYKIKLTMLFVFLLALPVIYCVLYFLLGYFLGWTNDAARAYYSGGENNGIMHMIIDMLLEAPRHAVFALLRGLLMALMTLPLMMLLPSKRIVFVASSVMLFLSSALMYLLPNPIMPADVAFTHFIANSAIVVPYGCVAALLLHSCLVAPAPVKETAAPAKAGAPATDAAEKKAEGGKNNR